MVHSPSGTITRPPTKKKSAARAAAPATAAAAAANKAIGKRARPPTAKRPAMKRPPASSARAAAPAAASAAASAAAPAAAPSESRLAATLKEEAGIADGRLPGVYKDEKDGHAGCPWRSGIRRDGFDVKGARHQSHAGAALRILEVYQAHPPYVATGRFTLAAGKHVDAAQLARLVEAARADAGR